MKPILPKTVINGSGLPQVCSVLASPGTTIILAPPFVRGALGDTHQSISLPHSTVAVGSQNVLQPTPVILPLPATKLSHCPTVLLQKNSQLKACSDTKQTKAERSRKNAKKEKGREEMCVSFKKSTVKNILPKVSQMDTQTLIIIPPPTPTFLQSTSSLSPSSSSVLSNKVALKPDGAKRYKIILQKKKKFSGDGGDSDKGFQSIKERGKYINVKDVCDSNNCSEAKLRKNKATSKDLKKIKSHRDNKSLCSAIRGKSKATGHEENANVSVLEHSKDLALKPREQYLSGHNVPHHPPPPYPCLLGTNSDISSEVSNKQDSEEKSIFSTNLSAKATSPPLTGSNLHNEREHRNPSSSPHFDLFESSNSMPCDITNNYQTCNPSVPSESFVCPTKAKCSNYAYSSITNHLSNFSQQDINPDVAQHNDNAITPSCPYTRAPACPSSTSKSRNSEPDLLRCQTPVDLPSYSSSPQPIKYPSSNPTTHLPSPYTENYNSSSIYLPSLSPSNHSPAITPQTSISNSVSSAICHTQLSSSPSPVLPSFSDATTTPSCNQLLHESSPHSYIPKATSYSMSSHVGTYTYSTQPSYHPSSSQQTSLYAGALTPASFSQSPETNIYTRSPQPTSSVAPHHPALYDMSPNASTYAESPQQHVYSPPHPSSYSHLHHQISYPSPQELSHSGSMQQSARRVSSQSPQSVRHPFTSAESYSDSPHQTSYCQSPETTPPIIARQTPSNISKDCQSPLLPPYSFPNISPPSQYVTSSASNVYVSSHNPHNPNMDNGAQHLGNKNSQELSQSYCSDKFSSVGLPIEGFLSPPSYEAHFQNTLSYSATSHPSSNTRDHLPSQQQSTPENYSVYHDSRYVELQDVSNVHMEHQSGIMGSPPAYPSSSASSLPLPPPPGYASDPHVTTPGAQHINSYPFTPDICQESQEYSPLEHTGHFFPNTPPMLPPPAAPPPVENTFNLPSTSTSQDLDSTHSASLKSAYSNTTYLPHSFESRELLEHRQYKHTEQQEPYEHHMNGLDSGVNNCRGSNTENSKVHDLIERAVRLWFIPQQEQNRVYMKRKELAKDFLNHSVSKSNRDALLKEKFWIEEDEPIAAEIVNTHCSNSFEEEQQQQQTAELLYHYETQDNIVSEGKSTSIKTNHVTKNKEMLCQICGKILKGRSSLKSHLNTHHNIQPHACPYCSTSFSRRSVLVQHLRIHTGEKPYRCVICDTTFRTRSGLKRHKSMHTNVRPFECSMCSKAFKTKLALQQHLKLHLSGLFTCPVCNKTFERHRSYVIHKASHYHNNKRFRCTHCSKGYRFRSLLNHHMQVHANIRKHVCPVCSKAFVWRSGLTAHMKVHSTTRPKCDICGARFLSEKRLATHYQRHSNKKPHHCEECGQNFAHAYRLASHKLVHQQRKEFSCSKCSLIFSSPKKLRKHLLSHKKEDSVICPLSGSVTPLDNIL